MQNAVTAGYGAGVAKKRLRAATREQVQEARARPGEPANAAEPPQSQGQLWHDSAPQLPTAQPALPAAGRDTAQPEPARQSPAPRRRAVNPIDATPESRYRYVAEQLELLAQLRQKYLDLAVAKKQAHDDWLAAADNAAANGVKVQDIAAQCGVTRSGLYQTLSKWRSARGR